MSSIACAPFNSEQETVLEFIQRFKVQCSEQLARAGQDGKKKAIELVKVLPVNVVTDLQRRIKPVLLSDATYDELEEKLTTQYEVKKSIVGASVQFLNRKQLSNESIENYARVLNDLASSCKYSDCCRDRMLRDTFVSGLRNSVILSGLLPDCEGKNFNDCVEKAKLLEQVTADAQDIKLDPNSTKSYKVSMTVPNNYICVRCGSKAKHFSKNCYALKLTCNSCKKKGHISKVCKSKFSKAHAVGDGCVATPDNTQQRSTNHGSSCCASHSPITSHCPGKQRSSHVTADYTSATSETSTPTTNTHTCMCTHNDGYDDNSFLV